MTKSMRNMLIIIALAVFFSVLGVWLISRSQPEFTEFRIAAAPSIELRLPTLVAIANGHFENERVALEEIVTQTGSGARQSLVGGHVDVALLATVHTPLARARGFDARIVMSLHDRAIFSIYAHAPVPKGIELAEHVRGKRIGVTDIGSGSWAAVVRWLDELSLSHESDVTILSLGSDLSTIRASLIAGDVDFFPAWEPLTNDLEETDEATAITRAWVEAEDPYLSMTLVTMGSRSAVQRETLASIVRAHSAALNDINTQSAEEIARAIASNSVTRELMSPLDERTLGSIVGRIKSGYGDGAIGHEAFNNAVSHLVEIGAIELAPSFSECTDTSFVASAP